MCNRICNTPSADVAIETMARRYGAISTTTRLCDMIALIVESYGWTAKPLKPIQSDDERYRAYEGSAIYDDVMEKSAEDFRLFQFVRDFVAAWAKVMDLDRFDLP